MGQKQNRSANWNLSRRCAQRKNRVRLQTAVCAALCLTACSAQTPTTLFDGDKAFALLKAQCDIGPRFPSSPGQIKTRDLIVSECKKFSDKVTTQQFSHHWSVTNKDVTMWNVVADMNFGAKKTILLLTHWDTRPYANEDPDPANRSKPIIGASDGASGTAVLLELMRAFKEKKPNVNICFLFVDGEDLGPELDEMFLGAKHFARQMKLGQYEWGILLDMVGDKNLAIAKEPNSVQYARTLVNKFYAHAASIGLSKQFPDTMQGYIADDHLSLNEAGLPTMDLIDFDYEPWHTLADTPDKCSAESLGYVGKALESFIRYEFR